MSQTFEPIDNLDRCSLGLRASNKNPFFILIQTSSNKIQNSDVSVYQKFVCLFFRACSCLSKKTFPSTLDHNSSVITQRTPC